MERLVLASARYFTRIPLVPNGQPRPSDTPNHWPVPKARAVLGKNGLILDFPLMISAAYRSAAPTVIPRSRFCGDVPLCHVLLDPLGVATPRIAIASAPW